MPAKEKKSYIGKTFGEIIGSMYDATRIAALPAIAIVKTVAFVTGLAGIMAGAGISTAGYISGKAAQGLGLTATARFIGLPEQLYSTGVIRDLAWNKKIGSTAKLDKDHKEQRAQYEYIIATTTRNNPMHKQGKVNRQKSQNMLNFEGKENYISALGSAIILAGGALMSSKYNIMPQRIKSNNSGRAL